MKHYVRSGIVAAGLVLSTLIGTTPAHAATAATFTGEVTINSFGTGSSTGTASLCVVGIVADRAPIPCTPPSQTNATASFSLIQNPFECPLRGHAVGTVTVQTTTGPLSGNFTWTRVGATAVINVTGGSGWYATGTAAFVVASHVGTACGVRNVKATIAGTVAGL